MNLEFFIARRIAYSQPGQRPGVMVRIAVISVALSLAVMILALAVIMGFKREVTQKMTAFAAHAVVTDVQGVNALESAPVVRDVQLEQAMRGVAGFASMHPYAVKGGIVKTLDAVQGILLKGVDTTYDWSFFEEYLVAGELPAVGATPRTKDILISRLMAERLLLGVGEKVEMLFVDRGQTPRRDRFKVAGIYASGMDEMDNTVIMTDLRNVQRLSEWDAAEISGYEIYTSDFEALPQFTRQMEETLLATGAVAAEQLAVSSVTDLYPNIFDWLRAHDVNAAVIIIIMLVVALFNMTAALLVLVMERTRMIGLLKALGMRNGAVRRIFLYRAAFIAAQGMLWGNLAGVAICLVQQHFRLVQLNAEGYLLSEVPIALNWGWWLELNLGVLVVIVGLLVIPTYLISYMQPDKSLRYQ